MKVDVSFPQRFESHLLASPEPKGDEQGRALATTGYSN